MVHSISILGSTGSIGRQTVAVAEHLGLNVRALTTNRNIQLAGEQARRRHGGVRRGRPAADARGY